MAATDGNVSARLGPDRVLVTPSGKAKGDITELDILLCDGDGEPSCQLDGGSAVPRGVENDDVEEGWTGQGEAPGELDRVAGLARDRVEIPLLQANGTAVEHVHGRYELKASWHRVTMLT